ncbi:MAG: SRPBCC family protein [Bacteroidetes bacterium]|nr:SRPBCC family protein [Bacteroidota bacterium]
MKNSRSFKTNVVTIHSSTETIWDLLFNRFGEIHLYNPNIEGSHELNNKQGEVGCERECSLDKKTFIRERIVNADMYKSVTIDVIGGNMPMVHEMRLKFLISPIGVGKTRVQLEVEYTTKPSFMAVLVKGMFRKMLFKVLVGLKYHLETGRAVSKSTYKPVSKQFSKLHPEQAFQGI